MEIIEVTGYTIEEKVELQTPFTAEAIKGTRIGNQLSIGKKHLEKIGYTGKWDGFWKNKLPKWCVMPMKIAMEESTIPR